MVSVTSSPTAIRPLDHDRAGAGGAPCAARIGHLGSGRPVRDPQRQRPRTLVGLRDPDGHRAVAWVVGAHLDADPSTVVERRADAALDELVDLDAVVVGGGEIRRQAGERARHVGGAAGDEEPRFAQARRRPPALDVGVGKLARDALVERVGVEERPAVGGRRRRHHVVERALDEIGVSGARRWRAAAATPASPTRCRRRSPSTRGRAAARSRPRTPRRCGAIPSRR